MLGTREGEPSKFLELPQFAHNLYCDTCQDECETPVYCEECAKFLEEKAKKDWDSQLFCSTDCAEHAHQRKRHDPQLRPFVRQEDLEVAQSTWQRSLSVLHKHFQNQNIPFAAQVATWLSSSAVGVLDDAGHVGALASRTVVPGGSRLVFGQMVVASLQSAWRSSVIGAVLCTAIECAYYFYLWNTDKMTLESLITYCGEALFVNSVTFGASLAVGAAGGALVGSVAGLPGAVAGSILGALFGGLVAYSASRGGVKALRRWWAKRKLQVEKQKLLAESLEVLGMSAELAATPGEIDPDQVKEKFHASVRLHHPDRGGLHENILKVYAAYACIKSNIDVVYGRGQEEDGEIGPSHTERLQWDADAWDTYLELEGDEGDLETEKEVGEWVESVWGLTEPMQTKLYGN